MQSQSITYSFIVPVYNRPNEIQELLESLSKQTKKDFEVVVVEDGSHIKCDDVVKSFADEMQISYYFKDNSGPGDSRNYGMSRAKGNYFLILDSDCIMPTDYLQQVDENLKNEFVDCFGGVDTAADSFTDVQKAINFAMTSVLTTGGVRGSSEKLGKFHPRSFNMGLSKQAFEATGGFRKIYIGEDIDMSIRLWKAGFNSKLFANAKAFHKRRVNWKQFKNQVHDFGSARPILNYWYPEYAKITYFFPAFFLLGTIFALIMAIVGVPLFLYLLLMYFAACFCFSSIQNKSIRVGLLSLVSVFYQFYGYGSGFIRSYWRLHLLKLQPEEVFPKQFVRKK